MSNTSSADGNDKNDPYFLAGQASIAHYVEFLNNVSFIKRQESIVPGTRLAVFYRESTPGQITNGNLDRQKRALLAAVRNAGGIPVFTYCPKRALQGYSEALFHCIVSVFRKCHARGIKYLAIRGLSRLVRHPDSTWDHHARPTAAQLAQVEREAKRYGITIISFCPATATYSVERSWETKWGGPGRRKGTRNKYAGWRRDRTLRYKPVALAALDAGHSLRESAEIVNRQMREDGWFIEPITHETVRKWDEKRRQSGPNGTA